MRSIVSQKYVAAINLGMCFHILLNVGGTWKGSQSSLHKQSRSIDSGKSLPKSNLKELNDVREVRSITRL